MSENLNLNLALDFVEPTERASSGRARVAAARVYIRLACCYLKDGGAPTITADCRSLAEFEREIKRLKDECDAILQDAEGRFRVSESAPGERGEREQSPTEVDAPSASRPSGASKFKTPVRLEPPMRVDDRMTRDVRTLEPNDKLSIADELMKIGNFRHVVVVDDGEVVGVVSHRDIFYGALAWSLGQGTSAHQRALESLPVKNVMHGEVTTVAPDTSLSSAARTMLERRVGCLPVVENERLVGILTEGDFLSMLTEADPDA
jgi:CBS domain-containing protein